MTSDVELADVDDAERLAASVPGSRVGCRGAEVAATPELADVDCQQADEFAAALAGAVTTLELSDGRTSPLYPDRWRERASGADRWLLDRCHGPTVDLGCGPGRLVEALLARGLSALGVDKSDQAIAQCGDRGVPVRRADIFTALPAEGRWDHALLADGNIGIGGDPVALLRRAGTLIRTSGTILVETTATPTGLWRGAARAVPRGPWFPWAEVGTDAIATVAHHAGLRVTERGTTPDRCFARLGRAHAH